MFYIHDKTILQITVRWIIDLKNRPTLKLNFLVIVIVKTFMNGFFDNVFIKRSHSTIFLSKFPEIFVKTRFLTRRITEESLHN